VLILLASLTIVAVASRVLVALRDRIEEDGQIEELPAGTFKKPGVYAVLISVMIPGRYR
jgi:hypothetical protein